MSRGDAKGDEGGHDGAGDGGEPAGDDCMDFGHGQLVDVGLDEKWGDGLTEKNVGGRVHRLAGGGSDGRIQNPSELFGDPLHDPEVEENVGDEAEEVDDGQRLEDDNRREGARLVDGTRDVESDVVGCDAVGNERLLGHEKAEDEPAAVVSERQKPVDLLGHAILTQIV